MPLTARERLIPIQVKIERAKKHFSDFKEQAEAFREAYIHVIGAKENPQTGQALEYFPRLLPVARFEMLAIAGDVIHNLRSALDHLAQQLVEVGSPGAKPSRHTGFPIFGSANEYQGGKARKVEGMRKDAIELIDHVKPYKGGNDLIWRLHSANNVDKHRFLVTVAEDYLFEGDGFEGQYWRKANNPLFRGIFGPEMNEQMQFSVPEALREAEVAKGYPLYEFLPQAVDAVECLVKSFRPVLQ
jgi:hypothetical protein